MTHFAILSLPHPPSFSVCLSVSLSVRQSVGMEGGTQDFSQAILSLRWYHAQQSAVYRHTQRFHDQNASKCSLVDSTISS